MWQRVQTLYLAIATILIIAMLAGNVGTIIGDQGTENVKYYEKTSYLIFLIMTLMANVIALFSFKARMLQMRVAMLSAILLVFFQIWLGVGFARFQLGIGMEETGARMIFSFTAIFPVIAAILNMLAARNIALDEAMVQSAYRLRKSKHRK
ncbi:MAG: DUF4293 domain-containing protein [Bacteroidetes bacterium]|uniref:DUF4293 domain-containing protein n=1 Tax=Candidatus Cryptobacteroides faecipullorum TaxID=2840764 RepID=A0A9D9I587_9BACT|nr:DUF4293 domain-containing protein [Candidatus Cryptobacteroides faecipullorum]